MPKLIRNLAVREATGTLHSPFFGFGTGNSLQLLRESWYNLVKLHRLSVTFDDPCIDCERPGWSNPRDPRLEITGRFQESSQQVAAYGFQERVD